MDEVFKIPITKVQLRGIPTDARNLLLLASHAVNQLSIVRKLLIFSMNYESESVTENVLSAGQSQTILRFLLGTLAETWEMVLRPINQKIIGKDYISDLGAEGVEAYAELKKHFGKSNLLHKIRNTIAYHYPQAKELEAAFEDVREDDDWNWYVARTINNSFYLASDLVISMGVIRVTGEPDIMKAFRIVMGIVVPISNELTDFLLYLMRAIIARHLGKEVLSPRAGTGEKITDAPDLFKFAIPFFSLRNDEPSKA
jgi:hypothetical protein